MKQFSLLEIISTAAVLLAMVVDLSRVFHAVDSATLQAAHRCTHAPHGMLAVLAALPTDKVINCTGMGNAEGKDTPAATNPLGSDKGDEAFSEEKNYPAAVGMLLYLSSNAHPDIQFAVHQVC